MATELEVKFRADGDGPLRRLESMPRLGETKLGEPRSMQASPQYDDVVADVHRFLAQRIFAAGMAGIGDLEFAALIRKLDKADTSWRH